MQAEDIDSTLGPARGNATIHRRATLAQFGLTLPEALPCLRFLTIPGGAIF